MDVGTLSKEILTLVRHSGQEYAGATRALAIALQAVTQKHYKLYKLNESKQQTCDLEKEIEEMP